MQIQITVAKDGLAREHEMHKALLRGLMVALLQIMNGHRVIAPKAGGVSRGQIAQWAV